MMETRDAVSKWSINVDDTDTSSTASNQAVNDAVSALTALGYKAQEAKRIVNKIHEPSLTREQLIRQALKEMVGA